jgi:hypothetical protein
MKIEGLDWIDMSSAVGAQKDQPKVPVRTIERDAGSTMADVRPSAAGSVELYLARDGTLIRLENAELCGPLDHANLLE